VIFERCPDPKVIQRPSGNEPKCKELALLEQVPENKQYGWLRRFDLTQCAWTDHVLTGQARPSYLSTPPDVKTLGVADYLLNGAIEPYRARLPKLTHCKVW